MRRTKGGQQAAPEETPLRRAINRIFEMLAQIKLADAGVACDTAMPLAEDRAASGAERPGETQVAITATELAETCVAGREHRQFR